MQTTKKKPSLIFILVGAVLAGYLGYLINGAWTEGIAFNEFMDRFNEVCAVPFADSRLELMDYSRKAYFQKIFNEMLDNAEMLVS